MDWFEANRSEIEDLANDPVIKKLNAEIRELRDSSQQTLNNMSDKAKEELRRLLDPY